MNQRIRELVKQAGGEFWQRLENDTVNPEAYITFDPPENLEKFAELIVDECLEVVGDCSVEYATRPQIIEEIKRHFKAE